jgi:predicted Zn-dependent peptidase
MTMMSPQLDAAFSLMVDLLRDPAFPEDEFEKVRKRWHGNLLSQRSDPAFLANERLFKEIYGSHPYSNTSIPIDHLEVFDCDLLRDFHQNQITPDGAYLMMAGNISLDQATAIVGRYLGDWDGEETTRVGFPEIPEIEARRFALVDRPHSAQTKILTGVRTVPQSDPSVFALKLANQVFGGSASARLFLNLREDKGYTYGAYSYQKTYKGDGILAASANVRTDSVRHSIREIFDESDRMGRQTAGDDELSRSKSEIIGSFLRQMETPGSVGSLEVLRLLMELPEEYYVSYVPAIRSLGSEEVRSVSKRYLGSGKMITTLVGDRNALEGQISEMGKLCVYDVEGNRIQ